MDNDEEIIKCIQEILQKFDFNGKGSEQTQNEIVSQQTKNAQLLVKELAANLNGTLITLKFEQSIYGENSKPHGNEKIDIVDNSTQTAYEIKYSGNNISHEFYKDVFKVFVYNQYYLKRISRFVFISESVAIGKFGKSPLFKHTAKFCKNLGITVILLHY